ncbi:permease, partial [Thermodesulfobacteriota bacterium]
MHDYYEVMDALMSFGPYRVAVIAYDMFFKLWYFLAIGIVIGAAFNVFVPRGKMDWIFRNSKSSSAIFIAAGLGALSPLGSYAVIPIFVTFLGIGIPMAPVVTFLAASPLINPFIFVITLQFFGLKMALARTFSALIVGVAVGFLFRYLERFGFVQNVPAHPEIAKLTGELNLPPPVKSQGNPGKQDAAIETLTALTELKSGGNKWKSFFVTCAKMFRHPGKWFVFSIILAAIVDVYIPNDWIVRSLGGHSYSLLLAAAMAIPFYVCGGGAVPLVWDLMRTGMDQGAALTFFVAGPVTRIAPMITVIAVLR